jgi:endonuclease YncB( thermonuclease family)
MLFTGLMTHAVDGDTYDFECDVSHFDRERPIWRPRIRCSYFDAPEKGDPGYHEATAGLIFRLKGQQLHIVTHGRDSFNRLLAETWIEGDEEPFSTWAIDAGYGERRTLMEQLAR